MIATSLRRAPLLLLAAALAWHSGSLAADAPDSWLSEIGARIEAAEYDVTWQADSAAYQAPNRAHGFRTYFTGSGFRSRPRSPESVAWDWGLTWVGYGRGGASFEVPVASVSARGNRAELSRGELSEWYENGPAGLEQGFDLPHPPEVAASRSGARALASHGVVLDASLVHLDLALSGSLTPRFSTDGRSIDFVTASGAPALRYADLHVTDASGTRALFVDGGFLRRGNGRRAHRDRRAGRDVPDRGRSARDLARRGWGRAISSAPTTASRSAPRATSTATATPTSSSERTSTTTAQADEGRAFVYLGSASGLSTTPAWIDGERTSRASRYGALGARRRGTSTATASPTSSSGRTPTTTARQRRGPRLRLLRLALGARDRRGLDRRERSGGRRVRGSPSAAPGTSTATASPTSSSAPGVRQRPDERGPGLRLSTARPSGSRSRAPRGPRRAIRPGSLIRRLGRDRGRRQRRRLRRRRSSGRRSYDNGQSDEGRAFVYLGSASGLATSACVDGRERPGGRATRRSRRRPRATSTATATPTSSSERPGSTTARRTRAARSSTSARRRGSPRRRVVDGRERSGVGATSALSVATAGDVNGDGYADVIVGAPGFDDGGRGRRPRRRTSGSAAGLVHGRRVDGGERPGERRRSAHRGDGGGRQRRRLRRRDRRAPTATTTGRRTRGARSSTSARPSGLAATPGLDGGERPGERQRGSAARSPTAGDVNGDGYADVDRRRARLYDNGEADEGRAFVYHGSPAGLATTAAWTAESDQAGAALRRLRSRRRATSTATATPTSIVGASTSTTARPTRGASSSTTARPRASRRPRRGRRRATRRSRASGTRVGRGGGRQRRRLRGRDRRRAPSTTTARPTRAGPSSTSAPPRGCGHARLDGGERPGGRALRRLGRDGGGRQRRRLLRRDRGRVRLRQRPDRRRGAPSSTTARASGLCDEPRAGPREGDQASALFGYSVATAGDVNGDGYSDVIIGVRQYDNGQDNEGHRAPVPAKDMLECPSAFADRSAN